MIMQRPLRSFLEQKINKNSATNVVGLLTTQILKHQHFHEPFYIYIKLTVVLL